MGNTRQEMTHMVNAMDRSYADQSTLHAEDPLSITYMDSHNFTPRCKHSQGNIRSKTMYIAGMILSKGLINFHILTMLNCINLYTGTNQFNAKMSALF